MAQYQSTEDMKHGRADKIPTDQPGVPVNNSVLTENVALVYSGCYVLQPWVIS